MVQSAWSLFILFISMGMESPTFQGKCEVSMRQQIKIVLSILTGPKYVLHKCLLNTWIDEHMDEWMGG